MQLKIYLYSFVNIHSFTNYFPSYFIVKCLSRMLNGEPIRERPWQHFSMLSQNLGNHNFLFIDMYNTKISSTSIFKHIRIFLKSIYLILDNVGAKPLHVLRASGERELLKQHQRNNKLPENYHIAV